MYKVLQVAKHLDRLRTGFGATMEDCTVQLQGSGGCSAILKLSAGRDVIEVVPRNCHLNGESF